MLIVRQDGYIIVTVLCNTIGTIIIIIQSDTHA